MYTRSVESQSEYYRSDVAFLYQGRGDINTYKLFTERFYQLVRKKGKYGLILPSGIYTDLGSKELRELLFQSGKIEYLFGFSNERRFFPGVLHNMKFAMIGFSKGIESQEFIAAFRINPREAISAEQLPSFIDSQENLIKMRIDTVEKFSPDSLSIMELKTQREVDVTRQIYGDWPLIGDEVTSSWNVRFTTELHMTNDSHIFNEDEHGLSLYEGKMIWQFDSFYAKPRYWVNVQEAKKATSQNNLLPFEKHRLAFRLVSSVINERTLVATILPKNTVLGHSLSYTLPDEAGADSLTFLVSVLNSYILDYLIRLKISANLTIYVMNQLPVPRPNKTNPFFDTIVPRAARVVCFTHHFAELWQEVMGTPWPDDPLVCPPPRSGNPQIEALRQRLRDEIDALVAHLYGLSRDDFAHILSTFPLVFPDTEQGRAKKEALLRVYDEFAEITQGWSRE